MGGEEEVEVGLGWREWREVIGALRRRGKEMLALFIEAQLLTYAEDEAEDLDFDDWEAVRAYAESLPAPDKYYVELTEGEWREVIGALEEGGLRGLAEEIEGQVRQLLH